MSPGTMELSYLNSPNLLYLLFKILRFHYMAYEVARPLSSNLKGGCHISCPFGCVGRGRARVVTHGSNLPRHGSETARSAMLDGSYPARGASQNRRP